MSVAYRRASRNRPAIYGSDFGLKGTRHFHFIKSSIDIFGSLAEIGLSFATHGLLNNSCRKMTFTAAILMLVSVLATATRPAEPFDLEVRRDPPLSLDRCRIEDGDRNGARVNAAMTLCWWYSLDAVTAGLVIKAGQILAFDLKLQVPISICAFN
jgi:hypothetical protein